MTPTEPRWNELLTLARKHLGGIGVTRKDWTWGGGTVLMLRHEHRLSWDIDLFLDNPQYLSYLSPRLNDAIAADLDHYTEQANHLRCVVRDVGEIDYLLAAPVVDVKPEWMEIKGQGLIQVMSDREILAQKIYYRGARFTGRDLFDFATVTALRPAFLKDDELIKVATIRRNALAARMDTADLRDGYSEVKLHPNATVKISFEDARAGFKEWLGLKSARPKPNPSSGLSM